MHVLQKLDIAAYDQGHGTLTPMCAGAPDVLFDLFQVRVSAAELLLDIGCANGAHLATLACRRIGVDLSLRNLAIAARGVPQARFVRADVLSLPFKSETVDYVFMAAVLHHLPDFIAGLQEASRVLKPGGRLIVLEGNRGGLVPLLPLLAPFNWCRKKIGTYPWHEENAGTIHVDAIIAALNENGLSIEKWYGASSFLSILVHGVVKRLPCGAVGRLVERSFVALDGGVCRLLRRSWKVYQFILARKNG